MEFYIVLLGLTNPTGRSLCLIRRLEVGTGVDCPSYKHIAIVRKGTMEQGSQTVQTVSFGIDRPIDEFI